MLCNWKPGDVITAHHLNQMVCAINDNTNSYESLNKQFNDKGTSSINSTGGINMGTFLGTALEPCESCWNRGFVRTGWEYSASDTTKEGIYANTSGVHNAISNTLTGGCMICLKNKLSGLPEEDIVLKVKTDCYGKILCQKIETQDTTTCVTNNYWQGPHSSDGSAPEYSFIRRIGRIVQDNDHPVSMDDSTASNKVISTNDLVMPILPARAEKEEDSPCRQSFSLIGGFKDNSVLIKNISNAGGLRLGNCATHLDIKSGVEFYAGNTEITCNGPSTSFAPQGGVIPQGFDITIACIPIKEQHYSWCKTSNSWVKTLAPSSDSSSEPSTAEPTKKGDIKITAKSLCGNNWQIGWASSGEVEIPVKDFTPAESVCYTEGRGISLTEQTTTDGKSYTICNTMEICAGCNISIEQIDADKPAYKINACKMKLEAGDGIKVECIQGGYKVSACESEAICINSGTGISVSKTNNVYTITNTAIHDAVEVVAGNGICVVQTGNKYKVSVKPPCSTCCVCICGVKYSFDPAWFIVTNNTVTINEAKINQVAEGIAPTVSSQITSTATASIDTYSDIRHDGNGAVTGRFGGDVVATVNTTCGTAATASFATRQTWSS